MSARGSLLLFLGGAVLGLAVAVLVGYLVFGPGYTDALTDNERLLKSNADQLATIERLQAGGHTISSGISAIVGTLQANDDRFRQLEDIELRRQENARRAIRILEGGRHVE